MNLQSDLPESFQDLWETFLHNQQVQIFLACAGISLILAFTVAILVFFKNGHRGNDPKTFARYIAVAGVVVIVIALFLAGVLILATKLAENFDPFSFIGGY